VCLRAGRPRRRGDPVDVHAVPHSAWVSLVADAGRQVVLGGTAAAHAVGISRPLAAYHLDKLVDDGLLETRYHRLGGNPPVRAVLDPQPGHP